MISFTFPINNGTKIVQKINAIELNAKAAAAASLIAIIKTYCILYNFDKEQTASRRFNGLLKATPKERQTAE